jgi:hypothetical protein
MPVALPTETQAADEYVAVAGEPDPSTLAESES